MSNSKTVTLGCGGFLLLIVLVLALSTIPAFFLMLALGALHTSFASVPALGFFACWLILFVIGILGNALRGGK